MPSELERLVTPRTKAIIVNSPCNPTGATYNLATLERLAELAVRRDLLLISDEIYEKVLYDGGTHTSIASLGPEVAARTVVINGVSKAYAMTGWRIGYAAGPKDLLTAMANIQSQSTSNPCSISQKAAVAALREGGAFTEMMVSGVRSSTARHGRASECDARGSLPYAHRSILCLPQCEWTTRTPRPRRNNRYTNRPRELPAAGIQGRRRSRGAIWKLPAYSTVVCDQHGHDRSRNGSPRRGVQTTHLVQALPS